MAREGPFFRFPKGRYIGEKVEDVLQVDPYYFMTCVKEYLDITPSQATQFRRKTGGSIPSQYIKKGYDDSSPSSGISDFIPPNYDDFGGAPEWWEDYKKEVKDRPQDAEKIYEKYRRQDLQKLKELYEGGSK